MPPLTRTLFAADVSRARHSTVFPTRRQATTVRTLIRRVPRLVAPAAMACLLAGCSLYHSVSDTLFGRGGPQPGQAGYVKGYLGEVVADEPRAALAGREVLSAGGDAADAAVAVGLSLAVTLPSRAGLGGGGACIATTDARQKGAEAPEAILFEAPPARAGGGDRPAAVPILARGLFLLHARHGSLPIEVLISKADDLARRGVPVSRALAQDLALVAGPLFGDPDARAVFGVNGVPLTEGQRLLQPALSATLAQLRVSGVGDMYQGMLARRIAQVSPSVGVPISLADLWSSLPSVGTPVVVPFGDDSVAFPPNAGGVGAAAAFVALAAQPADLQGAWNRSIAAAERWRQGGVTSDQLLHAALPAVATPLYPASTTFATLDATGNAVACAVTMNNLFGTGRMLPGLGFIAAASPSVVTPPLLATGLAWHRHSFRAEAAGSGQSGAALAAAAALINTLRSGAPMPSLVPDPGRVNVVECSRYLPGSESSCTSVTDPRGFGLATGGQ